MAVGCGAGNSQGICAGKEVNFHLQNLTIAPDGAARAYIDMVRCGAFGFLGIWRPEACEFVGGSTVEFCDPELNSCQP
jgi:hypothetical protein